MAAPHVAGVAALVKQAHPKWWKGEDLKAAIVNTGNPAGVLGNRISRGGTGLVQPFAATQTSGGRNRRPADGLAELRLRGGPGTPTIQQEQRASRSGITAPRRSTFHYVGYGQPGRIAAHGRVRQLVDHGLLPAGKEQLQGGR